jgi:hypothetical protein
MPITAPAVGDPTKQTLIQSIIDALAAAEVDIASIVGERLVTNGSFEVDSDSDGFPDQWTRTLYTGGAFALVDDTGTGANSAHGLKAIKFTHPGGGGNGGGEIVTHADTYIEASPNRPYLLTWQNKNSVAGVTNSVEVIEYDATQTLLATVVVFSATTNPTTWTLMRSRFTPSDPLCRYIKLRFKCGETSASTAGTIFIDNVQLQYATKCEAVFTTGSFHWTAPPGVYSIEAILVGGGGGGESDYGGTIGGGGGGGGGTCLATAAVTPGTRYNLTIGAGGAGGVGGDGTTGGTTSVTFDLALSATGGVGGGNPTNDAGGAGGTGSGGYQNLTGTTGENGITNVSGAGGYSLIYYGSAPAVGGSAQAGIAGPLPGSGGSGGTRAGGGGSYAGGAGAGGVIILRW